MTENTHGLEYAIKTTGAGTSGEQILGIVRVTPNGSPDGRMIWLERYDPASREPVPTELVGIDLLPDGSVALGHWPDRETWAEAVRIPGPPPAIPEQSP